MAVHVGPLCGTEHVNLSCLDKNHTLVVLVLLLVLWRQAEREVSWDMIVSSFGGSVALFLDAYSGILCH